MLLILLQNKEWTCRPKVQQCPEISCEGETVIMGCCPVCEGSDNRPPRNLPVSECIHTPQYIL